MIKRYTHIHVHIERFSADLNWPSVFISCVFLFLVFVMNSCGRVQEKTVIFRLELNFATSK